jgi:hypothetical protein
MIINMVIYANYFTIAINNNVLCTGYRNVD